MPDDLDVTPAPDTHPGLRVLLVEDDAANQAVERLMLEHLGHSVDVVADGAAAVLAAAAREYDAILMDCHMPVMNGYDAATAIRGEERAGDHVPIIGLTAHHDRQRCVEAGMDDQLAKPFALSDLAGALERVAPADSPAFDGVLDPATVDQLRMLAETASPDLLHKLQAAFARDTPVRMQALRAAVAADDAEALAFNVHTLKGSAANLGAIRMVATCQAIEDLPARPDRAALERLLGALEEQGAEAQAALSHLAETS